MAGFQRDSVPLKKQTGIFLRINFKSSEGTDMNITKSEKRGWTISIIGALFFFYAVIQANVLTPICGDIAKAFGIDACGLSILSSWYFYANLLFILPAGLLLDRYSVKYLMLGSLVLAIIGTFMFAYAIDIRIAYFGRFLCGIMMSFGLVSCLKLASLLLPAEKMAIASSLIVTVGMVGGVCAQAPIAYLSGQIGWRGALMVLAFCGVVLSIILWAVIKAPKNKNTEQSIKIWDSLKAVFRNRQNWFSGLFISFINFPVAVLGALFGVPYLTQVHGFLFIHAAAITSMLFFGMIFGSPFFGWISDHIKKRKPPMYVGSIFCLIFMLTVIYLPVITPFWGYLLFFLVGFTSSCQVLGYPIITENNPPHISGAALSLSTFLIMGLGYCLGLPFVGWLLNYTWDGKMVDGIRMYSMSSYQAALLTLPVALAIGILMAFLIKETNCRPIYKK